MKSRFTELTALLLSFALVLPLLPAAARAEEDLSGASVTLSREVYEYNGSAHEPEVTVTLGGVRLQRDVDYTVAYRGNVKAGEASVTVTGTGDKPVLEDSLIVQRTGNSFHCPKHLLTFRPVHDSLQRLGCVRACDRTAALP